MADDLAVSNSSSGGTSSASQKKRPRRRRRRNRRKTPKDLTPGNSSTQSSNQIPSVYAEKKENVAQPLFDATKKVAQEEEIPSKIQENNFPAELSLQPQSEPFSKPEFSSVSPNAENISDSFAPVAQVEQTQSPEDQPDLALNQPVSASSFDHFLNQNSQPFTLSHVEEPFSPPQVQNSDEQIFPEEKMEEKNQTQREVPPVQEEEIPSPQPIISEPDHEDSDEEKPSIQPVDSTGEQTDSSLQPFSQATKTNEESPISPIFPESDDFEADDAVFPEESGVAESSDQNSGLNLTNSPLVLPQSQEVYEDAELASPQNAQSQEENPEVLLEEEIKLAEKKSFFQLFSTFLNTVQRLFSHIDGRIIKNCLLILFLAVGIYIFYVFHFYQSLYQYVYGILNPSQPPQVEIQINENELNIDGINTALLFAHNQGSQDDRFNASLKVAFFFGKLAEPQVKGETGITPAYYYGLLQDQIYEKNRFILYVENLRKLQDLYHTDVYAMLDQTTQRDKKLLDYLDQLNTSRKDSDTLNREILAEIDDLKVSDASLSPDLKNFENDFFASLQNLAGEKSDFLLKSFIDANQKHVALKAKLGALQKLADYYTTALNHLDIRIQAVDKNRDALIQGIHVIDIPGSDLNIIIKSTS